jgi:DNA-binding transcriptional MerR regulator
LDINEVARRSGVPASTLRYYDAKGLIRSIGRRGLRRVFDATILERLALISLGQSAGFSLEDISRMFTADGKPVIDRRALSAKADELEATMRRLAVLRDGLRHAAACSAPSHLQCPTFRRLLAKAAARSDSAAGARQRRQIGRRTPQSGVGNPARQR